MQPMHTPTYLLQELTDLAVALDGRADPIPPDLEPEALLALASAHPSERPGILRTLLGSPSERVRAEFERALNLDPDPRIRRMALAQAAVDPGFAIGALVAACRAPEPELRRGAAEVLAGRDGPEARAALRELLGDADATVAGCARRALGPDAAGPAPVPARLLERLRAGAARFPSVRRRAFEAFVSTGQEALESLKAGAKALLPRERYAVAAAHYGAPVAERAEVQAQIWWDRTPPAASDRAHCKVAIEEPALLDGAPAGVLVILDEEARAALRGGFALVGVGAPGQRTAWLEPFELTGAPRHPFRGPSLAGVGSAKLPPRELDWQVELFCPAWGEPEAAAGPGATA